MRSNNCRPPSTAIAARRLIVLAASGLLALNATTVPTADAAASGKTQRVSVATGGTQGNSMSGRRGAPVSSADGRFIAFDSLASNLVSGDTNAIDDVFVRDSQTGTTERVSVSTSGAQGNAISNAPAISADGRFVAFESSASNLVPGDTNGTSDIFLRDRQAHTTMRVSVATDGTEANGASFQAAVSADGRFVAFASDASNLVSGDTNGTTDVFVRDLRAHTTQRVSLATNGTQGNHFSVDPSLSADGRFVAFTSFASNLVRGDTNGADDVFVRDRRAGTTKRVSVASNGAQGNDNSFTPDISGDGRIVAFASQASNLVAGDTNGTNDVFVRDLRAATTARMSVGAGGVEANGPSPSGGIRGGFIFGPSISSDGRFVAFDSSASNLVAGDTNTCVNPGAYDYSVSGTCPDVFVRDRQAGTTERVSVATNGRQTNDASTDPGISGDGRVVAFFSAASNLVAGDTNACVFPAVTFVNGHCPDIFTHTR